MTRVPHPLYIEPDVLAAAKIAAKAADRSFASWVRQLIVEALKEDTDEQSAEWPK